MNKCLLILISFIICTQLAACAHQVETDAENTAQTKTGVKIAAALGSQRAVAARTAKLLDSLAGYYIRGKDLPDGRSISLDFFIYREDGHYYGYMNMLRYERIEGQKYSEDFQVRLLVELERGQETIQAVCVEDFSEEKHQERFGAYQKGDLLFTLAKDREELHVSWNKFMIDGLEDINFFPADECLSVELISQRDIELFLQARGMEGKLFFRYDEDSSGMENYLEVYYDKEKEAGAGVYCNVAAIEDEGIFYYYSGFDISGCRHEKWEDHRYDVIHYGKNLLEVYDFEKEYNENGQLKKLETRGTIEGWADSPYEDTIARVVYFYREDGSLERRECYYNQRVFGTTECTQTYYYDEMERLQYVYSYITHGQLQTYYIYEGDQSEPEYCIRLDFFGACASTDYIVRYDKEQSVSKE